jgi:hypothetical protein
MKQPFGLLQCAFAITLGRECSRFNDHQETKLRAGIHIVLIAALLGFRAKRVSLTGRISARLLPMTLHMT